MSPIQPSAVTGQMRPWTSRRNDLKRPAGCPLTSSTTTPSTSSVSSSKHGSRPLMSSRHPSYHQKFSRLFVENGIDSQWSEALNGWFRDLNDAAGSPLIGRAHLGRKGGDLQIYTRYLEPEIIGGVQHWLWSQQKPIDSILNIWLALDSKTFPPKTVRDISWHPNASLPLNADHLLRAAIYLLDSEGVIDELPPQEIGRPLLQGITALAAGFLGSDEDRRQINVAEFFLLQLNALQKIIAKNGLGQ